jgi:hypothetical protein
MSWFRKILGLCDHKWQRIQVISIYGTWGGKRYPGQDPAYHKHVLQCEKCGNEKVVKI